MLEPVRAFDELLRVTRTGGRVAVIDGDWATLDIDPMTRMLRHDCPTFRPRSDRRTLSLVNACVDCSHATDCETSRWTSAPFLSQMRTRHGAGNKVSHRWLTKTGALPVPTFWSSPDANPSRFWPELSRRPHDFGCEKTNVGAVSVHLCCSDVASNSCRNCLRLERRADFFFRTRKDAPCKPHSSTLRTPL